MMHGQRNIKLIMCDWGFPRFANEAELVTLGCSFYR